MTTAPQRNRKPAGQLNQNRPSHLVLVMLLIALSAGVKFILNSLFDIVDLDEALGWGLLALPGIGFTVVMLICSPYHARALNRALFLLAAAILYICVFYLSLSTWGLGAFILPSLGAVALLKIHGGIYNFEYSKKTIGLSALTGPISGILVFACLQIGSVDEGMPAAIMFPIAVWWIYMAVLLDHAVRTKNQHV